MVLVGGVIPSPLYEQNNSSLRGSCLKWYPKEPVSDVNNVTSVQGVFGGS